VTKISHPDPGNRRGEVVDRASEGSESRSPAQEAEVAELPQVDRQVLSSEELIDRFKQVPRLDYGELRNDLDAAFEPRP